jgi:TonB family protein
MSSQNYRHPELFTPSGCLTGEALSALTAGTLTESELKAASDHLLTCPLCADAAEGMTLWMDQVADNSALTNNNIAQRKTPKNGNRRTNRSQAAVKAEDLLHERTSRISQRISSRLHTDAPATGSRRLAYKPFVWLSVAATILLFVAVYFGVLMQKNISDRLAAEREKSIDTILPGSIQPFDTLSILVYNDEKHHLQKKNRQNETADHPTNQSYNVVNETVGYADMRTEPDLPKKAEVEITSNDSETIALSETDAKDELAVTENKAAAEIETDKSKTAPAAYSKKSVTITTTPDRKGSETKPGFVGGETALNTYLLENIKYPPKAIENQTQGTVYVSFTIEKSGKISNIRVVKGIGNGCDEEAVRVVRLMPKWVAGQSNGKAVDESITLPIRFVLDSKTP